MSKLNIVDRYTKYTRVPVPREALETCDEDRLDDALADALGIIQNSPHLAIGYNQAYELYLRKGQGLLVTEIYGTGLKAIGEDNPTEKSILQKHRREMKPHYREFVALVPPEITKDFFLKLDHDFLISTCAPVCTTWLPKIAHSISDMKLFGCHYTRLCPIATGRLLDYIDTLRMCSLNEHDLAEFNHRGRLNEDIAVAHLIGHSKFWNNTSFGTSCDLSQSYRTIVQLLVFRDAYPNGDSSEKHADQPEN